MNEQECLNNMIAPSMRRPNKPRGGVIQIHVTRACDKACFGCTQGSNLRGPYPHMTLENFEHACESLNGYWGVVGIFGGNPTVHPDFPELCRIARLYFPQEQLGLWCNKPFGHGKLMRETFNPAVSNLNVHLDQDAYNEFKRTWPESRPFGLGDDSRHSPVYVAMKDVIEDEGKRWELISNCDINKHWSAMVCQFRGELRGFFCEIAGAQAMLHQDDPDYPDTGIEPFTTAFGRSVKWWELPMMSYKEQVNKHCHECGVPLRGYGELACSTSLDSKEQVSETHAGIYKPKKLGRQVELVQLQTQLNSKNLKFTEYIQGGKR